MLEDVKDSVSATDFETLQKASGQNYNADGVLADRALRRFVLPATVHHNDAMHCSVANGIAQFEVTEFFRRANTKLGVKYEPAHAKAVVTGDRGGRLCGPGSVQVYRMGEADECSLRKHTQPRLRHYATQASSHESSQ